eukprot:c25191_g4_i1 orf=2409-2708(-)
MFEYIVNILLVFGNLVNFWCFQGCSLKLSFLMLQALASCTSLNCTRLSYNALESEQQLDHGLDLNGHMNTLGIKVSLHRASCGVEAAQHTLLQIGFFLT